MAYEELATQIGMNLWLLYIILIWETIWTGLAMWKTAKKGHVLWFIVFLVVNLLGIPEIIYLAIMRSKKNKPKAKPKRKVKRKKR